MSPRVLLDEQHLVEGELRALLAGRAVDFDDGAGRDLELAAAGLNDGVHVIPLVDRAQAGQHKGLSLAHEKGRR